MHAHLRDPACPCMNRRSLKGEPDAPPHPGLPRRNEAWGRYGWCDTRRPWAGRRRCPRRSDLPGAGFLLAGLGEALQSLAELPLCVLMTVGHRVDLDSLAPFPDKRTGRIPDKPTGRKLGGRSPWCWPRPPWCSDTVDSTTMGAIAAGLPQVVAPIFTDDQVVNARHVAAVGVGRAASPGPDGVSQACPGACRSP